MPHAAAAAVAAVGAAVRGEGCVLYDADVALLRGENEISVKTEGGRERGRREGEREGGREGIEHLLCVEEFAVGLLLHDHAPLWLPVAMGAGGQIAEEGHEQH